MSRRNAKKAMVEAILDAEAGIGGWCPPRPPGRAKHKKSHRSEKSGPDLYVGMPVAVTVYGGRRMSIVGYLGGILLDWEADAGWWKWHARLIVYVVGASKPRLSERYCGRIIARTASGYSDAVLGARFSDYKIDVVGAQ